MPRGDTLEKVWEDSFADVPSKYGERWLFFHRVDLHAGLRQMAEDPDIADAPPATINLGCEIVDVDCDDGSFQLKDGTKVRKDLVVIANGVHCRFVENVTGRPNPTRKTGRTVYRCLIPMSEVMADPLTAQLFENQPPGLLGPNIPAHGVICGTYPCRRNTVLNLAYLKQTKPEDQDQEGWNLPATIADVEKLTNAFHPALQELPRKADDIKAYNMTFREEIPTFVKGRAVLIGDAAHPMLTYHAQGATMSIESTGALEVFFRDVRLASEIPDRLQLFNQFRHPRCVTTQIMSNVTPGPQSYPGMVERVRKYYDGPLPPATSKPWGENFRDFFFPYDVLAETEKFLNKL